MVKECKFDEFESMLCKECGVGNIPFQILLGQWTAYSRLKKRYTGKIIDWRVSETFRQKMQALGNNK